VKTKIFSLGLGLVLIFVALFGNVSTVFAGQGDGFVPVTLCHASPTGAGGSGPAEKYEEITVDNQGALNGHIQHPNDLIPMPEGGCPVIEPPDEVCEDESANNYGGQLPCTYDPDEVCEDESANNYGGQLPCTYDPEVCNPDYNGPEEGCGDPGGLDVPTCEEMSQMTPEQFSRWTNRWERLGCLAQGYQTGSGDSGTFWWLFFVGLGMVIVSGISIFSGKRKENTVQ
jgi:hypothetical protein